MSISLRECLLEQSHKLRRVSFSDEKKINGYCMRDNCMRDICMHVIASMILHECYNHKLLWLLLASSLIRTLLPLLLHV